MRPSDDPAHPSPSHSDRSAAARCDRPDSVDQDRWALSSSDSDDDRMDAVPSEEVASPLPRRIGRYEILRKLGTGGFAIVYLARDRDLDRYVAIKVPRPDRLVDDEKWTDFVEEARKTAQFDHPGILRVYDVQREPDYAYIVQQYVDGSDLASYAKEHTLTGQEIAEIMILVADAVGYAHDRGFVHRDLKPSNILIDQQGKPYVADFGLAIHENMLDSRSTRLAGTYAFMSPEQVRGESHRTNAQSDIWSLGVVLYQLLTRRLPFDGSTKEQLRSSIVEHEPDPPAQFNPQLSGELSRICLTCLAKPASERYQSTDELIADLKLWMESQGDENPSSGSSRLVLAASEPRIEPQGLRTFESRHADFFLALLPGCRDRNGLPKSVRFWKSRIESRNDSETFSVGLMYGPSGCGKSSLVQAGILPRLGDQIRTVLVDASTSGAIDQIANKVRAACTEVAGESSLRGMIGTLRLAGGSEGRKVLLVIDQFEQFLHGHHTSDQERLASALRQADGAAVQVLILVRDDYFGSVNRFFRRLEIPIMEGRNAAMVDLFDPDHAGRVLIAYGRAFGKLPDAPQLPTPSQQRFLHRAVQSLAEEGKVSCVRLVIFAEMMKSRPWTESSLRELGGIAGVGVRFLQEQFNNRDAPASQRLHQEAVRRVLEKLIAEEQSSLKGPRRSYQELLEASGYQDRPDDFETVLQMLDRDLRLITPADVPDKADETPAPEQRTYQLSHDYLAPAVRQWLNLHQLETRAGRAKLRLEERTRAYVANRQRRNLPSAWEFANISLLTRSHNWSPDQKMVMHQARRLHAGRALLVLLFGVVLAIASNLDREKSRANELINQLLLATPENLMPTLAELNQSRSAPPLLHERLNREINEGNILRQVKLRLALLPVEPEQSHSIRDAILMPDVPYSYMAHVCDAVADSVPQDWLSARWNDLRATDNLAERRFRAGVILARVDPDFKAWSEPDLEFLARGLIRANEDEQVPIRECLRPIVPQLKHALLRVLRDDQDMVAKQKFLSDEFFKQEFGDATLLTLTERSSLATATAEYAADDVEVLCEAVSLATPAQFRILYPAVERLEADSRNRLLLSLASQSSPDKWQDRPSMGQLKAAAAITLLRLGSDAAVPIVLDVIDDVEPLTQFVHGLAARGVEPTHLIACWRNHHERLAAQDNVFEDGASQDPVSADDEASVPRGLSHTVLYGLLLALGEFDLEQYPEAEREFLVEQASDLYADHPRSGVHAAAGWLLRRWAKEDLARKIDSRRVDYQEGREWFTMELAIPDGNDASDMESPEPSYMTFVVFEPGVYSIGSRRLEIGHKKLEMHFPVQIPRRFAVLDREVSVREFTAWSDPSRGYGYPRDPGELAFGGTHWQGGVGFCAWLTDRMLGNNDSPLLAYAQLSEKSRDEDARHSNVAVGPEFLNRLAFRMPTEYEWEVACLAGTDSVWSFGSDIDCFNFYSWNHSNAKGPMLSRLKRPNLRGLFDVHGNLKEWVHDWHGPPDVKGRIRLDVGGNATGSAKINHGGGFNDSAVASRAGVRSHETPDLRPVDLGLRVVIALPGTSNAGETGAEPGVTTESP